MSVESQEDNLRVGCITHIFYRRAVKLSVYFGIVTSIVGLVAGSILYLLLGWMGVNAQVGYLLGEMSLMAVVDMPSGWQVAGLVLLAMMLNVIGCVLFAVVATWLFNLAAALTGGIAARFEIMD